MTEKIRLDYQMFRWGPLLVKFKIPDDMRKKLLEEANASHKDFEKNLAGVITKEVGFRDIEMFKPFFHTVFEMYADAQSKWAPEVGSTIETFKDPETSTHHTTTVGLCLGLYFYKCRKN